MTWTLDDEGTLTINGTGDMKPTVYMMGADGDIYSAMSWYKVASSIKKVIIADGVTNIADYAFYNYSLEQVIIGNGVTSMGNSAFCYCYNLTSIDISDGINIIGSEAFYNCNSLVSITIPDSVTSITYNAFSNCEKLTDVFYGGNEEDLSKIHIEYIECLANANIHYIKSNLDEPTTFEETVIFKVSPQNANWGDSVIVATYDKIGQVIDIEMKEYKGTPLEFEVISDYDTAKIMLWDSFAGMKPLAPAKIK